MTSPLRRRHRAVRRVATLALVPMVAGAGISALSSTAAAASTTAPCAGRSAEASPGTSAKAIVAFTDGNYLVVTRDPGATTYQGTRSVDGRSFDAKRGAVTSYRATLEAKHQRTAASVGAQDGASSRARPPWLLGQAHQGPGHQARRRQERDARATRHGPTARDLQTPKFLGLEGAKNAVWTQLGGYAKAGDGVVVGDVDSGAWPESDAFAGAPITATPQGKWGLKRVNGVNVMKRPTAESASVSARPARSGPSPTATAR